MRALFSINKEAVDSELSNLKKCNIHVEKHEVRTSGLIITFKETDYRKMKRYSEKKRNIFIERTH